MLLLALYGLGKESRRAFTGMCLAHPDQKLSRYEFGQLTLGWGRGDTALARDTSSNSMDCVGYHNQDCSQNALTSKDSPISRRVQHRPSADTKVIALHSARGLHHP